MDFLALFGESPKKSPRLNVSYLWWGSKNFAGGGKNYEGVGSSRGQQKINIQVWRLSQRI